MRFCGASHPAIDGGSPCIKFDGHIVIDADNVHQTARGFWWEAQPSPEWGEEPGELIGGGVEHLLGTQPTDLNISTTEFQSDQGIETAPPFHGNGSQ